MAYFAQLDENNKVIQVISISNDICPDPAPDNEQNGIEYIVNKLGLAGSWKQTSFNASFRYNYASVGGSYLPESDAFVGPQPYPSWVLNTSNFQWDPPTPHPGKGLYFWDEASLQWVSPEE